MGRHSAPDDGDDEQVAAAVPAAAGTGGAAVQIAPGRRPRPGRHAHPDEADGTVVAPVEPGDSVDDEPHGLEMIEQVLEAPPSDDDTEDGTEDDTEHVQDTGVAALPDPVLDVPAATDETGKIAPVVGTERDASVPEAVTEQIPAVRLPADTASQRRPAPAAPAMQPEQASPGRPEAGADDTSGPAVPDAPAPGPASPAAANSDLALLRSNSTVRARVIAALLVPFVLYVAVLVTLAEFSLRTFLIWIWVPLISAGVLAGLILDTAQRRPKAPRDPASADDQTG